MGICLRYSRTREEAVEIVNDGFVKVFTKLGLYSKGRSFKGWLRRVMINAAIDYFRRNEKHYNSLDISHGQYETPNETILDTLAAEEIIAAIQRLPPSYRMVFNLFVIEGYKHEEIANQLNISTGTCSKPGKARRRRQVSKPSRPGIWASSTMMSGVHWLTSASARSPLDASVICMPRSRRASEVNNRLTSSSSTSSTRGCRGGLSSAGGGGGI